MFKYIIIDKLLCFVKAKEVFWEKLQRQGDKVL